MSSNVIPRLLLHNIITQRSPLYKASEDGGRHSHCCIGAKFKKLYIDTAERLEQFYKAIAELAYEHPGPANMRCYFSEECDLGSHPLFFDFDFYVRADHQMCFTESHIMSFLGPLMSVVSELYPRESCGDSEDESRVLRCIGTAPPAPLFTSVDDENSAKKYGLHLYFPNFSNICWADHVTIYKLICCRMSADFGNSPPSDFGLCRKDGSDFGGWDEMIDLVPRLRMLPARKGKGENRDGVRVRVDEGRRYSVIGCGSYDSTTDHWSISAQDELLVREWATLNESVSGSEVEARVKALVLHKRKEMLYRLSLRSKPNAFFEICPSDEHKALLAASEIDYKIPTVGGRQPGGRLIETGDELKDTVLRHIRMIYHHDFQRDVYPTFKLTKKALVVKGKIFCEIAGRVHGGNQQQFTYARDGKVTFFCHDDECKSFHPPLRYNCVNAGLGALMFAGGFQQKRKSHTYNSRDEFHVNKRRCFEDQIDRINAMYYPVAEDDSKEQE